MNTTKVDDEYLIAEARRDVQLDRLPQNAATDRLRVLAEQLATRKS